MLWKLSHGVPLLGQMPTRPQDLGPAYLPSFTMQAAHSVVREWDIYVY